MKESETRSITSQVEEFPGKFPQKNKYTDFLEGFKNLSADDLAQVERDGRQINDSGFGIIAQPERFGWNVERPEKKWRPNGEKRVSKNTIEELPAGPEGLAVLASAGATLDRIFGNFPILEWSKRWSAKFHIPLGVPVEALFWAMNAFALRNNISFLDPSQDQKNIQHRTHFVNICPPTNEIVQRYGKNNRALKKRIRAFLDFALPVQMNEHPGVHNRVRWINPKIFSPLEAQSFFDLCREQTKANEEYRLKYWQTKGKADGFIYSVFNIKTDERTLKYLWDTLFPNKELLSQLIHIDPSNDKLHMKIRRTLVGPKRNDENRGEMAIKRLTGDRPLKTAQEIAKWEKRKAELGKRPDYHSFGMR